LEFLEGFLFETSKLIGILTNFWNNQPTKVVGIGAAIFVLLGIYISFFTPDISIN